LPPRYCTTPFAVSFRWRAEFVGRDDVDELRLDPVHRVRRAQRGLHVVDPHFAVRVIVRERAGADPLLACDAHVGERHRAFADANRGRRAVHPDAAKTRALERESSVARPRVGIARSAADRETDGRRARPFPFAEKFADAVGRERADGGGIERAFDVEAEIAGRVEQVGEHFAAGVPHAHIAEHRALAVP
jgi:hypothetical protein